VDENECTPQIVYFEVWDAAAQAPTGEIIDSNNKEVCFPPSAKANIEAVTSECTRRVLLQLTRPDGSTFNRNEGKLPYLVFGDHIFEDPPRVNGRFFEENGSYSISAYPKSDPTANLTYTFNVKLCDETPVEAPTQSPTEIESPTNSPVIKPPTSGNLDCMPSQGVCATTHNELQAFLDAASPYDIVAVCDGATIDTSGYTTPITISKDHLTLCCTGSDCVLENNGSGRNLLVTGSAATVAGIEFVGGKENTGGNVYMRNGGDGNANNIIDCIFQEGTATDYFGGNLMAEFMYPGENSITIERSTFVGGTASWGGGAFITDSKDVFIRDCNFTANTAGSVYGGSGVGGGLMISSEYGKMPKLEILNTVFNDNIQGAVAVFANYNISFSGNSGGGNTPHTDTDCPDFYGPFGRACVPLSDELPKPYGNCFPSTGACASSRDELQVSLDAAGRNYVVAICDGTTIDTSNNAHITMAQDQLTLCCEGFNCVLENDGNGRNLVVNGASTSVIGIEFVSGFANTPGGFGAGGNVDWNNGGNTWRNSNKIIDCTFRDGVGFEGGNLAVRFMGPVESTMTIERSTFVGGKAQGNGGAIFITDAHDIFIRDCNFTANEAGTNYDSAIGGAIAISSEVGEMPQLEILNTVFQDNIQGTVGVLPYDFDNFQITLSGNSAQGNTPHAASDCKDLYEEWTDTCLPLVDGVPTQSPT